MNRRILLVGLGLIAALAACTPPVIDPSARTTVILVRHADRVGDVLSIKGRARAANLPQALENYRLDAIYSPDIARNLETADPLSQALNLPVTIIPKEGAAAVMSRAHPQGTVVWIGNKGNLRTIWASLNAPGAAPQDYGEIGVVTLQSRGRRDVARLFVAP